MTQFKRAGRPGQSEFDSAYSWRYDDVAQLIDDLVSGSITPREFADRFDRILFRGNTESWILGRQRAGDATPLMREDLFMGRMAKDRDAEYILRLVDDIAGGRYTVDGDIQAPPIQARANLYLGRMRGAANESFVRASDPNEQFLWQLGGNENHCTDCPEIAKLSPFTVDTLFTYPAAGDTPCLGNCLCYLERSDGILSYKRATYIPSHLRAAEMLPVDFENAIERLLVHA